MTPGELDAIEKRWRNASDPLRDDAPALHAALREAWAEVERLRELFCQEMDWKDDAQARAEKAEDAIARVRALCDGEWLWSVPITYIATALDGEAPADA